MKKDRPKADVHIAAQAQKVVYCWMGVLSDLHARLVLLNPMTRKQFIADLQVYR